MPSRRVRKVNALCPQPVQDTLDLAATTLQVSENAGLQTLSSLNDNMRSYYLRHCWSQIWDTGSLPHSTKALGMSVEEPQKHAMMRKKRISTKSRSAKAVFADNGPNFTCIEWAVRGIKKP